MHDKISLAQADESLTQMSEGGRPEALCIARLLVEQHGSNAPVQAAYRRYSLANSVEWRAHQLMLETMKLVGHIRPDALVSRDT